MSQLRTLCEAKGVQVDVKCGVSERVRRAYSVSEYDGVSPDWRMSANPYTVTIRYRGRQMTVPFYTGSAWTKEPDAADVLSCLCSDATSVENARDFAEWCNEFGYDVDSRRAYRTWQECKRNATKVRRLLGDDFDIFANGEH